MTRQLTEAAQVAKQIRTKLKAQGLAVRVTSSNFSMGDSVDVHMTDQPPAIRKLVEQLCGFYRAGSFNGMEDIYDYRKDKTNLPTAKYISVTNSMSDAMRDAIYQHVRQHWAGGDELPEKYEDARNVSFHGTWVDQFVYRQFAQEDSTFWKESKPSRPTRPEGQGADAPGPGLA